MDVRNRLAHDVIVVPLSTTLRPAPTHVVLPAGKGGLKETSMAKCEQVTTLDKAFLLRGPFAGTISPSLMRDIENAIQRAIGIVTE
jgi:mRNA-degrading endonuclease toxin of MazEF toxin-antitoxin module